MCEVTQVDTRAERAPSSQVDGPAGFYSLSPLIPADSVMKWGVSPPVSQGGNRDWGESRGQEEVEAGVGPRGASFRAPSAGTPTPDPYRQLSPHSLWVHQPLPFAPGLGSRLRFLFRCHLDDKVWLAGWGWGGGVAWGVGSSASREWGPGRQQP